MGLFTFISHAIHDLLGSTIDCITSSAVAVFVALTTLTGICAITYLRTYSQSLHPGVQDGKSREPPHAPYWIPWIRNTLSLVWDTEGYITRMQKHFPPHTPFRMSVPGASPSGHHETFIYAPPGDLVSSIFRSGHKVSNKTVTLRTLRDQFGVPASDQPMWTVDDSGLGVHPLPGFEDFPLSQRIYHIQHREFQTHLTGAALDVMTARFVRRFRRELLLHDGGECDDRWTDLPDLFLFLRDKMFNSAVHALCGSLIFETCPNLVEEFWAYERALNYLLKRVPRWLAPGHYRARDVAIESIRRWQEEARKRLDWGDEKTVNAAWEPLYGSRLMRARQQVFERIGQSDLGTAAVDLGMLWAANANIIPATFWALFHVLQSPDVTARLRAEAEASSNKTGDLDMPTLCSKPLFNSVYQEGLRVCVATTVARSSVDKQAVTISGSGGQRWTIPGDATVFSISWFGGHDESFWNRRRRGAHSVDSFWAERFMEINNNKWSTAKDNHDDDNDGSVPVRTTANANSEKASSTNMQGYMFPYGGGMSVCPGRFFAKQEMMAALAVLLLNFDIEITESEAALNEVKCDKSYFPLGAMPPDRKVAMRIRRRET
ncbi:Cytochrome P450 [Rhypophila sp. PSN 637]